MSGCKIEERKKNIRRSINCMFLGMMMNVVNCWKFVWLIADITSVKLKTSR